MGNLLCWGDFEHSNRIKSEENFNCKHEIGELKFG